MITTDAARFDVKAVGDRTWLARYVALRLALVFWLRLNDPANDWKGPREDGWQTKIYASADYCDGMQVGVKTGVEIAPRRFLLDADFDWAPGIRFVHRFLPQTPFAFGRPSKPLGHAFYTTSAPVASKKFTDVDVNGTTIIERRGTKADGSIGLQTMLPPSFHRESGEQLSFVSDGDILHSDAAIDGITLYAVACVLGRHWPRNGPETNQHDTAAYAAGFLCTRGVDPEKVPDIIEVAATLGGDDNVDDRLRYARDTVKKFLAGGRRLSGGPKLAKEIGQDVVDRLREFLGDTATDDDVVMRGGDLTAIVDRAEAALLKNTAIYQRGGTLTRAIRLDAAIGDPRDVRREAGSTMLAAVREPWLLEQMGQVLRWFRVNKDGGLSRADPGAIYARTLGNRCEWRFPVLRGVVAAPTLARDGRIIEQPGFDAASGLLLDFAPGNFPCVPPSPSYEDAHLALARLSYPLRGFPFVSEAAKAVALSACLTALVRPNLRTSPLHGFDAPAAGTGKSLLAELAGLLATGSRPPALSQGKTAEEDEKRLSTVLFAGDSIVHIDNCERPIFGDFLCSLLTQEIVQARILGLSERRVLPSTALVLASGNNLTLSGDVSRRAVICRLDAKVERPDTRTFDFDCHAEVLAARPELVVAGLTILRAYHVAGRPVTLIPMGSFADWEWIRGALVWLECADPAETRTAILDVDPTKNELVAVMDAWELAIGSTPTEVAAIENSGASTVRDLLVEVACRAGVWSGKSVGKWLARHRDRVVGHRSFRSVPNSRQWVLEGTDPKPPLVPRADPGF